MTRAVVQGQLLSIVFAAAIVTTGIVSGGCSDRSAPRMTEDGSLRVPVTRDTWVSAQAGERGGNNGGSTRLKLKGHLEMILLDIADIDWAEIDGSQSKNPQSKTASASALHTGRPTIESVSLFLHPRSSFFLSRHESADVRRISVSTVASPWQEGSGRRYKKRSGASFASRSRDGAPWKDAGADVTTATFSAGETAWAFSQPLDKDGNGGFRALPIEPHLFAARLAGLSYGFALFDDVGSEYRRDGDTFEAFELLNRYLASREAGTDVAPFFELQLGPSDHQPPHAIVSIEPFDGPVDGPFERWIEWQTPADRGPAGTAGFDVRVGRDYPLDWETAQPIARTAIPLAREPGETVRLHLRDLVSQLGKELGDTMAVGIRPVDAVGHRGPVTTQSIRLSTDSAPNPRVSRQLASKQLAGNRLFDKRPADIREPAAKPAAGPAAGPGGGVLWVADSSLRVEPLSGDTVPPVPDGYKLSNSLWSASSRTVTLSAGKNEFVSFLTVLEGIEGDIDTDLRFDGAAGIQATIYRTVAVEGRRDAEGRLLPDPLLDLRRDTARSSTDTLENSDARARVRSLVSELYIPHSAPRGHHRGTLQLRRGNHTAEITIDLEVLDFTLPDHLSFVPQLNTYKLPAEAGGPKQMAYYRFAHRHRTVVNRLAYNWQGEVRDGHAPAVTTDGFDFEAWDRAFGPLFDGSAFADLPRAGVPIEAFYLPVHENWPIAIEPHWQPENGQPGNGQPENGQPGNAPGYWIEDAVHPQYFEQFEQRLRQIQQHLTESGWSDTFFEVYLNNRIRFKQDAGSWSASSAPWNFDEPIHTQDFWALRRFGLAVTQARARAQAMLQARNPATAAATPPATAKMLYRVDVSRPQWQRDLFDGIAQVEAIGHAFYRYRREIVDRQRKADRLLYNYGTPSRPSEPAALLTAWCLLAWAQGADGVMPWQSLGEDHSWQKEDDLSLIYPPREGEIEPHPSLRLKALLRGQQDVEYLSMLEALGVPRWQLRQQVLEAIGVSEDARPPADRKRLAELVGTIDLERLHRFRTRLARTLDRLAPAPRRRIVELSPRRRGTAVSSARDSNSVPSHPRKATPEAAPNETAPSETAPIETAREQTMP